MRSHGAQGFKPNPEKTIKAKPISWKARITDWGGNLFREEEMCFYFEVVQRTLTKDACLHVHVIFCLQHNKTFRTSCCPRLNEVRRREG